MKELLQHLLKLQSLEFDETGGKNIEAAKTALRAKIPLQILGHFDRLIARGKKALAVVSGQVCSGCHMQVPLSAIQTLKRGDDLQLCENCGRYLYLPSEAADESAMPPVIARSKKKPRKAKKTLQTV
jgi:predicted  nucleic acid-binding Zn-ribbon protein